MKIFRNTYKQSGGQLLTLVLLSCLLVGTSVEAQNFNQKYNVHLIGQVVNDVNGAPIKNHEVTIVSDTVNEPGYYYTRKVYTDNEGYYYDTILTTLEKGAFIIKTLDHQDGLHDTTVHYRFTWSENTILFANFVLPAPPLINVYQANFTFAQNPSGNNKMEYQFTDLTENAEILCWSWYFGDNTYSQEQNPVHVFEAPGLYKVELTVYIITGNNSEPVQSKMVKFINVSDKAYFHMGGHVFAGYFPIDKSEVYLYKIEGSEFVPIDTAIFNDSLGYFLFYQLIEGEYILKADLHPSSSMFNMFLTTYYSDKLHWDEADTIFHYETNFEYDINLAANNQSSSAGPGSIGGHISYHPDYGGGKGSQAAENVSILLYDAYDNPVNICHSDENGDFTLNQLDLTMYYVYAEVTGKTTIPVEVILEENMNGVPTVQLIIDNQFVSGAVNSGVSDHMLDDAVGQVFPNPAHHTITIQVDEDAGNQITCSLMNTYGQLVRHVAARPAGDQSIRLDVNDLPAAVYFLRISDSMGRSAIRKFIKH